MQRKYADYRELSSSLHQWIRESTLAMQDRNFPPTLIEVKKLLVESNRFRTEEVPPRNREKQHITRIFKEVEVTKIKTLNTQNPKKKKKINDNVLLLLLLISRAKKIMGCWFIDSY